MNRAEFEAYESRVEAGALDAHLEYDEPEQTDPDECTRCRGYGSTPGTDEPCTACQGAGDI